MSNANAEEQGGVSLDTDDSDDTGEYTIEMDDDIIEDLEADAAETGVSVDEVANGVVAEHRASDILTEAATKIQDTEDPSQDVLNTIREDVSKALNLLDLSQKPDDDLEQVIEEAEKFSEQMDHIEHTRNADGDTGDVELYIIHEAQRVADTLTKTVSKVLAN